MPLSGSIVALNEVSRAACRHALNLILAAGGRLRFDPNLRPEMMPLNVGGSLDPGYPLPGKVRQAQFILPKGMDWKGLKLKAEIEVKGVCYPMSWACHQKANPDGTLTLRPTKGLSS